MVLVGQQMAMEDARRPLPCPSDSGAQMACAGGGRCEVSNRQRFMFPLGPQSASDEFQPSAVKYPQWFGLQWYHPHIHEQSKDQLERGLAGALADLAAFGLVPDLWAAPEGAVKRTIKFTQRVTASEGAQFFLDVGDGLSDQQFSHEQICEPRITATLGDVEEWTVENWTTDIHAVPTAGMLMNTLSQGSRGFCGSAVVSSQASAPPAAVAAPM